MSDKLMWFGNENHMQWVPAPATGMQVDRSGVYNEFTYDSGGRRVNRTNRTSKSYSMEFPVREASGYEGLDVFSRFASGLYGDLNKYPIYFSDPMNYDQNLFPEHWAAPGLFSVGWPSLTESLTGNIYNYAPNPSLEYSDTTWASATQTVNGRTAGTAAYGGYFFRITSASTPVPTGMLISIGSSSSVTLTEGTYDFGVYVRCSTSRNVTLNLTFKTSTNVTLSTETSGATAVVANTWTRVTIDSVDAPFGTGKVVAEITGATTNWANGNTLDVDAYSIIDSGIPFGEFFDGDSTDAYWMGTEGESTSFTYLDSNDPSISLTSSNSYQIPAKKATFNIRVDTDSVPVKGGSYSDLPYCIIPIPEGYTLWFSATGSNTGTAYIRAISYDFEGTEIDTVDIQLSSETAAIELTDSLDAPADGCYAKVFLGRSSRADSTITISSMTAQLWPTGVTPPTVGDYISGSGNTGCMFVDSALSESYVMYDPYHATPIHYKGLSTSLLETCAE